MSSAYRYAMPNPGTRRPLSDRFWPKVDRRGPDECWPWLAALRDDGYGQINRGGREGPIQAHVASYLVNVGPVPDGCDVHHRCRNRACVNPGHLEAIPHEDHPKEHRSLRRTRCARGHDLTDDRNLMPDGRRCRACRRRHPAGPDCATREV